MDNIENVNLNSFEMRKKRAKRAIITLVIAALIVAAAAGLLFLYAQENKVYNNYETIGTKEKTGGALYYTIYRNGVLRVSKDGAEAIGGDGSLLWNVSYTINDPIYAVCEKAAAVADRGGRTLYIMDGTGSSNPVETLYPIHDIDVANQGVTAVLMTDGSDTYIKLYSIAGKELADINTVAKEDGFPVDIALSNDGTKLVTSYVTVKEDKMHTQITCYNFGGVGQNYLDNLVGSYYFEDKFCPKVEFINNSTFCVFLDDGIEVYKMPEIPAEAPVFKKVYTQELRSIFYNETYIGVVTANTEENARYLLELYDMSGNTVFTETINSSYNNIVVTNEEVIYYDDLEVVITKLNGTEKFRFSFPTNIDFFLPAGKKQRYLVATDTEIMTIKLTQKKDSGK